MSGSDVRWLIACFGLGVIGTIALLFPLFGFLNYVAAFVFPLVLLAEIAFGVVAVMVRGRWRSAYTLGNLGILAGTVAILVVEVIPMVTRPGWQPDPVQWAPAYFGVVMMGLAGGITLAMRR